MEDAKQILPASYTVTSCDMCHCCCCWSFCYWRPCSCPCSCCCWHPCFCRSFLFVVGPTVTDVHDLVLFHDVVCIHAVAGVSSVVAILLLASMLLSLPMLLLVVLLLLALLFLASLHYECCSMISLLLLFSCAYSGKVFQTLEGTLFYSPMPENSGF
jgi:hypothetical protein